MMLRSAFLGGVIGAIQASSVHSQVVAQSTHPSGEVAFVVDLQVKPGMEAEFERLSLRSVRCARQDPGNVAFDVHRVIGAERTYLYRVVWRSPEALRSHLERPYTKDLLAMFERALARPLSESIRYVHDLSPSPRPSIASGDPADDPNCR